MGANLSINMLQALTSSWLFKKTRRGRGWGASFVAPADIFLLNRRGSGAAVMSYEMMGRIDPDGELEISSIRSVVSG